MKFPIENKNGRFMMACLFINQRKFNVLKFDQSFFFFLGQNPVHWMNFSRRFGKTSD